MNLLKYVFVILVLVLMIVSCKQEEVEEDVFGPGKYVMYVVVTGSKYVGSDQIETILGSKDTISLLLATDEYYNLSVPDTVLLKSKGMASISLSKNRFNFKDWNSSYDTIMFNYTETISLIQLAYLDSGLGLVFKKESGELFVDSYLIDSYKHNGGFNSHFRIIGIHDMEYSPGNWPNMIGEADTVNYYKIKFRYKKF